MAHSHVKVARRFTRSVKSNARIFRVLSREAVSIHHSLTGDVGLIYSGHGIEAVWVSKVAEKIDRRWFRQHEADLLVVIRGRLRVEFPERDSATKTLGPGDVLVLPPETPCRAYRWPREARRPTVFVAVYRVRPTRDRKTQSRR